MFNYEKHVESFLEKMTDSWLTPRGIMFSEGFALTSAIKDLNADIVLESGTAFGGSCEMMALMCPNVKILTTDLHQMYNSEKFSRERLSVYSNVLCKTANSQDLLPTILARSSVKNAFIFIDGPKGNGALQLAFDLLNKFPEKILAIGIHDVRYDSPVADQIRKTFNNYMFTDDPEGVFNEYREKIDSHMLDINVKLTEETKSSLDKELGLGYLQSVLKESPRGFGLALIGGPFNE